jgi:hypothetical protein
MVAPEHARLSLHDLSAELGLPKFQPVNVQKRIAELTLADLLGCLQKRAHLDQVIDLVLDQIAAHWAVIDRYYRTEVSAWYQEVVQAIVTLPYTFWDVRATTHQAFCTYIRRSDKWQMEIEPAVLEAFLAYVPQLVCWTRADADDFVSDLSYGHDMGILGNLIQASKSMTRLKTALLHGQPVWLEPTWQSITTEAELLAFIDAEYADFGEGLDFIKEDLQKHSRVMILPAT